MPVVAERKAQRRGMARAVAIHEVWLHPLFEKREFEDARLIQRGLLPRSVPSVAGLEVAAAWQPANGVGGDCFDTLAFGASLGVSVADVAGKGLPARRVPGSSTVNPVRVAHAGGRWRATSR